MPRADYRKSSRLTWRTPNDRRRLIRGQHRVSKFSILADDIVRKFILIDNREFDCLALFHRNFRGRKCEIGDSEIYFAVNLLC